MNQNVYTQSLAFLQHIFAGDISLPKLEGSRRTKKCIYKYKQVWYATVCLLLWFFLFCFVFTFFAFLRC